MLENQWVGNDYSRGIRVVQESLFVNEGHIPRSQIQHAKWMSRRVRPWTKALGSGRKMGSLVRTGTERGYLGFVVVLVVRPTGGDIEGRLACKQKEMNIPIGVQNRTSN